MLPHVVELATNEKNWPKLDNDAEQPEWVKPQDSDSLQQTADMGSHGETVKPDKNICDTRTRSRLRKIANKNRQTSNNNNREHPEAKSCGGQKYAATPWSRQTAAGSQEAAAGAIVGATAAASQG